MISRIFQNTRSLLLMPLLGLILWGSNIWDPAPLSLNGHEMIGYRLVHNICQQWSWLTGISFFLILVLGVFLFYFNEKFIFIRIRTTLAAAVFMLLVSVFPEFQTLTPGLIGCVFLVWSLYKLFGVFKQEHPIWRIFDTSLILSIGSLFCFEINCLLPAVFIGLSILNVFSLRTFLATLFGWVLPYFFVFSVYFYLDQLPDLLGIIEKAFFAQGNYAHFSQAQQILLGGMGAILFVSIVFYTKEADRKKISSRKYFNILFVILFTFILLIGLKMSLFSNIWPLICVPLSLFLAHFFSMAKGRFSTLSFLFLLVISLFAVYF